MLLGTITMQAQNAFIGQHRYDGEHKNEISGYAMAGNNVVVSGYGGFGLSYKRHLTDRWHVGADVQQQWGKQLYSNDVQGPPVCGLRVDAAREEVRRRHPRRRRHYS